MDFADPARIDRQIEETAQALVRWRQRLREDPAAAQALDPFAGRRGISTRAALQSVQKLPDGLPGKDSLVRWVSFLTIERVTLEDRVEFETALRSSEHRVEQLGHGTFSLRNLAQEAVMHPNPDRRAIAADALTWRADDASSNAAWWQARRHEAASQLGLPSLAALESPFAEGVTAQTACEIVLDETEDLAREVLGSDVAWQEALTLGTAMDAVEGWPARLTARWLQELFGASLLVRGLHVVPGAVPPARNGASFLRAVARFGAAVHRGAASALAPSFTLAQQPFDAGPASYGALLSSLLASPAFVRRRLGVGAPAAPAQVRAMMCSLLIGMRLTAAKAWIAASKDAVSSREAHATAVAKALRASMPAELAGLTPRYDPRSAAQLAGALIAALLREELIDAHDEDWFDNPRGQQRLREIDVMCRTVVTERQARDGARAAARFLGEPFR